MKFYRYQQGEDKRLVDHMRNFKDLVGSIKYHGGDIFFDKDMMECEVKKDIKNNIKRAPPEEYRRRTTEKAKAVAFIKSVNRKTYGRLLNNVRDQHSFKIDIYPKTLADAYQVLSAHTTNNNNQSRNKRDSKQVTSNSEGTPTKTNSHGGNTGNGMETSYLQTEVVPGNDGRTISHITCYSCQNKGHYADNCPNIDEIRITLSNTYSS